MSDSPSATSPLRRTIISAAPPRVSVASFASLNLGDAYERAASRTRVSLRTVEQIAVPAPPLHLQGSAGTFFNIASALVGGGTLQMAYMFRSGGLALGVFAIIFLSGLCAWTMTLIPMLFEKAAQKVPEGERHGEVLDWPLVGRVAFGLPGKIFLRAFFLTDLLLTAITLQVLSVSCLHILFPMFSSVLLTKVITFSTIVLFIVPEWLLSSISAMGLIAVATFAISVMVSGAATGAHSPDLTASSLVRLPGAMMVLSTVGFGMIAHSEAGAIYAQMENKASWSRVSYMSFACAGIVYTAVGVVGYLTYGDDVRENLLDNVGADPDGRVRPDLAWLRKLAAAMFTVKLQVVQPLLIMPIADQAKAALRRVAGMIRRCLFHDSPDSEDTSTSTDSSGEETTDIDDVVSDGSDSPKTASEGWTRYRRIFTVFLRCVCTVVVGVVAMHFSGKITALTDLTGSVVALGIAVTIPPILRLVLFRDSLRGHVKIALMLVSVVGLAMQTLGVWQAVKNMAA